MKEFNLVDQGNKRISLIKLVEKVFNVTARNSKQYATARVLKDLGMSDLDIVIGINAVMSKGV
jgi:hypothetical protein